MKLRVGIGYDVHRLEEDLPFRLGGVNIPHNKGAKGHSDADTLIHAICDAMLGASASGDIGMHFPDTEPDFKGIDSTILLKRTLDVIVSKGFRVVNLDSVIILQKPKISSFIPGMRKVVAAILDMDIEDVSIKATTTEKLGFAGREEGVAAQVVILLERVG